MAKSCPLAEQLHFTTLAQAPEWLPSLAGILAEQRILEGHPWPHEKIVQQLSSELSGGPWPCTTLALHPIHHIVACVRLAPLAGKKTEGLWLSNLWVAPALRGQGVGRWLCRQQGALAKAGGMGQLQLYTHTHERFYAALGWQTQRLAQLRGRDCYVMRLLLK